MDRPGALIGSSGLRTGISALQVAAPWVAGKMGIPYVFPAYAPIVLPSAFAERRMITSRSSPVVKRADTGAESFDT